MKAYLIGDAIAPVDDIEDEDDEEVVSSQAAGRSGVENVEKLENYGTRSFPHIPMTIAHSNMVSYVHFQLAN